MTRHPFSPFFTSRRMATDFSVMKRLAISSGSVPNQSMKQRQFMAFSTEALSPKGRVSSCSLFLYLYFMS